MKRILTCYNMFRNGARRCTFRFASLAFLTLIAGTLYVSNAAVAESITINTGTYEKVPAIGAGDIDPAFTWNYTGDFSDTRFNAYTYGDSSRPGFEEWHDCHMAGGDCRVNNTYGPDATGQPAYTGVQFYYASFDLPAEATNVVLTFTRTYVDDRMGIHLNGTPLGYWSGFSTGGISNMTGLGSQPSLAGLTFNGNSENRPIVTGESLFILGGTNVVRFWVNNTGSGHFGSARPHSSGNPSALHVRFTVTYEASLDSDGDGVLDADDLCPATAVPETVPTVRLRPNRWALIDDDSVFDTLIKGKGKGPNRSYIIEDTAGCSCEQIIEAQGLGNGHTYHGCSISAMDEWIEFVTL